MKFPRYAEYKDSGVEWLGEVPGHWDVWKASHAFASIGSGTTPPSGEIEWYEDGVVPWVTTGELRDKWVYETEKMISEPALRKFSSLRVHPAGALVIAMYGATIGRLGILGVDATTNQACCVLSNPLHVSVGFMFYWFLGKKNFIIDMYATGGGQPNINREIIASLRVAAPVMTEQSAIAAFLDRETFKIDALVAEQENLIALLKEKRQAVISHAVTKGLNPAAPMKDSGIEWLGEVPGHWKVGAIKYFVLAKDGAIKTGPFGSHLTSADMQSGTIKVYNQRSVIDADFDAGENFISEKKFAELASFETFPGDLLITTRGTIGRAAILPENAERGILHPCLLRLQPDNSQVDTKFLMTLIQDSDLMKTQLNYLSNATTIDVIYSCTIASVIIPVPPVSEQDAIMQFLADQTTQLDTLTTEAHRAIDLLKERRSALISAVVTGKIDVRGLVPMEAV